jgi:hypothetical protein
MGRPAGAHGLWRIRQKAPETASWTALLRLQPGPAEPALLHGVRPDAEPEVPVNLPASDAASQSSHAGNCTCLVEIINQNWGLQRSWHLGSRSAHLLGHES